MGYFQWAKNYNSMFEIREDIILSWKLFFLNLICIYYLRKSNERINFFKKNIGMGV